MVMTAAFPTRLQRAFVRSVPAMTVETIHQEFERLGEPAVEELFVRQGRDNLKRVYAVRWLGESAFERLAADAARERESAARKIRARRARRAVADAVIVLIGSAIIAVLVLGTAVFH
jgi:N-methylhydantoinase A/oxoprolinase/acetone carboxylase beta subunit